MLLPYFALILFRSMFAGPGDGSTQASIIIAGGHLIINGTGIDSTWKYYGFHTALGKAENEDGRTENFESKGIVFWKEGENYEEVTEFKVNFLPDEEKYWSTQKYYSGTLTIEGMLISSKTTAKELQAGLPAYKIVYNEGVKWYEGMYKGIFLYAQFDKKGEHLVWIDFGVDDENSWN